MINADHPRLDAAKLAPGLWIGSHPPHPGHRCEDHRLDYGLDLKAEGFDVLVLCAQEYQPQPWHFPGVQVIYAPFDDDPNGLPPESLSIAYRAAAQVVASVREGKRVLVTCWAGRNRSGLVAALALAKLARIPPSSAGEVVRNLRGLGALTNTSFRQILARESSARATCDLCEAKPLTPRLYEDQVCWIANCVDCRVPMCVFKEHGVRPPARVLQHMLSLLGRFSTPGLTCYFDDSMTSIPTHYHVHLRKA